MLSMFSISVHYAQCSLFLCQQSRVRVSQTASDLTLKLAIKVGTRTDFVRVDQYHEVQAAAPGGNLHTPKSHSAGYKAPVEA